MNYDFSEKEFTLFVDINEKMAGLAANGQLDRKDPAHNKENIKQALKQLAQTPYLKLGLQPVDGYQGQLSWMGAAETLAAVSPSAYLAVEASTRLFGRAVNEWGDSNQKSKWLTPLLEGNLIGALAISEETLNIENDPLTAQGERQGESVAINGAKQYVINAPIADWIAVAGTCDDAYALFLIEKEASGLTVEPAMETLGYDGTPISGIRLEDCRIPNEQVIFPPADIDMAEAIRMWENQILLGAGLGLSKAAYETARDHAKSHRSGGKPIIAYQEVGFKLADMLTLFQTSQLLAYRTAWTAETSPKEAGELLLCAKVFCAESAEQVCSEALKILGGNGYITGNSVERAYRCAKYVQIAGTSTEIGRVKIGDAALGYRN
ncbi:MAG: acyl-CoA dehydrogenase [Desulfobacterales bacterium]|nr:acyl-CoA dehydrogenase [Desulfobacterales bacterium]